MQQQIAEGDAKAAIEHAFSLGEDDPLRSVALSSIASNPDRIDPETALAVISQLSNSSFAGVEKSALLNTAGSLSKSDYSAFARWWGSAKATMNSEQRHAIQETILQYRPDKALEFISENDIEANPTLLSKIGAALAVEDPEIAFRWLEQHALPRGEGANIAFGGLVEGDPAAAGRYLSIVADQPTGDSEIVAKAIECIAEWDGIEIAKSKIVSLPASLQDEAWKAYWKVRAKEDPAEAFEQAIEHFDEQDFEHHFDEEALLNIVDNNQVEFAKQIFADGSPPDWAIPYIDNIVGDQSTLPTISAWIASQSGEVEDEALMGSAMAVVHAISRDDPEEALTWAETVKDPELKVAALNQAATTWARQDPVNFSEWLGRQSFSSSTDPFVENLVANISSDPERAFQWSLYIKNESRRNAMLLQALEEWSGFDPASARSAILSAPIGEQEQEALLPALE